jgi:hypothetical protein
VLACVAGARSSGHPRYGKIKLFVGCGSAWINDLLTVNLAKKTVKLRKEKGEFIDLEELLSVPGISSEQLRKLKTYLFIESVDDCNC